MKPASTIFLVFFLVLSQASWQTAVADITPSQRERLARIVELVSAGNTVAFADLRMIDIPLPDRVRSVEAVLYGDNDQGRALVAAFIAQTEGAGAFVDANRLLDALQEAEEVSWRAPLLRVAGSIEKDENLKRVLEAELDRGSSEPAIQLALIEALPKHDVRTGAFVQAVDAWVDGKHQEVARAAALALLDLTLANVKHDRSEALTIWRPQIPRMLEVLRTEHVTPPAPSEELRALEEHAKAILLGGGANELNQKLAVELLAVLRCSDARIIPWLARFSHSDRSWAFAEARGALRKVQFSPKETAVKLLMDEVSEEGDPSTNSFIIENLIRNDYPSEAAVGLVNRILDGSIQPREYHLLARTIDYCRARNVTNKEVVGKLRGLLEENSARAKVVGMFVGHDLRANALFTLAKLNQISEGELDFAIDALVNYPQVATMNVAAGWSLYAIDTKKSRELLEKHIQGLWKDGFTSAPVDVQCFGNIPDFSYCSSTAVEWLQLIDLAELRPGAELLDALQKIASTEGHATELSFVARERELARGLVNKFR